MTEEKRNPLDDMNAEEQAAYLVQLKAMADTLGVTYSANIGLEKLNQRIKAHQEGELFGAVETGGESLEELEHRYAVFRAKQTIRVSLQCLNPAKNKLVGDVFTVYSTSIGRQSQWVPYQAPEGYHMPRAIAEFLKTKQFLGFREMPKRHGETGVDKEHVMMNEFIIRELPPLEFEEWKNIMERQQIALGTINPSEQ